MLVNKMNLWKKGHQAIFNFNCRNGLAWMNVSTIFNASEERDKQAGNQGVKKKQPSTSKRKRNALRAAKFREKLRLQKRTLKRRRSKLQTLIGFMNLIRESAGNTKGHTEQMTNFEEQGLS